MFVALIGGALGVARAEPPIEFRDVTDQTGIVFRHTDGSSGRRYIVETVTAGLALFDYNGDGRIDVYFLNGAPLAGSQVERPPRNALYRNEGGWKFSDVTEEAGLGDTGFGLGVAAADYDNDGDLDVYVNNFGPNVLYRNNGDGTFDDVTDEAGVGGGNKVGAGACFLDADGDGDLDLYCANYVRFTYENHVNPVVDGFPQYAGPKEFDPEPDTFYRNNGDGTFSDASVESGIAAHAGTGMGVLSADYDNDGDADVMVLNDVRGNFLFQNDGRGRFRGSWSLDGLWIQRRRDGVGQHGTGLRRLRQRRLAGRFLHVLLGGACPVLYRNTRDGMFEDVTRATGAGVEAYPHVCWGTGLVDFNNDGHRDLFVACGHLQDNVHLYDDTTEYRVRDLVFLNTGRGRFVKVSGTARDGSLPKRSSRGAAFDDLDGDGDVDAVILNSRDVPTVLRNETETGNHWLQIRLRGTRGNRDGVGARVRVTAGDLVQVAEVHSGLGLSKPLRHAATVRAWRPRARRLDRSSLAWGRRGRGREGRGRSTFDDYRRVLARRRAGGPGRGGRGMNPARWRGSRT